MRNLFGHLQLLLPFFFSCRLVLLVFEEVIPLPLLRSRSEEFQVRNQSQNLVGRKLWRNFCRRIQSLIECLNLGNSSPYHTLSAASSNRHTFSLTIHTHTQTWYYPLSQVSTLPDNPTANSLSTNHFFQTYTVFHPSFSANSLAFCSILEHSIQNYQMEYVDHFKFSLSRFILLLFLPFTVL